ncbi:unnamed protein product [Microthlaspi erraticum]|uniref:Uncharacterized protein n=1 Tax=Microthlaspi erraticum TaxID=1685480 RepID=A0A6D2HUX0_9BRAS|nr:unnamed protein product [Microthlaspi erraticum]
MEDGKRNISGALPKEASDKFHAIHQELNTWFDISSCKFEPTSAPDQAQEFSNNLSSSDNIMQQISDTSFECKDLQTKLSGDLVIILAQFVDRVLSFIAKNGKAGYKSVIPDAPGAESHLPTKSLAAKVGVLVNEYVEAMGKDNLKQGLIAAMHIAGEGNLYVFEQLNFPPCFDLSSLVETPWKLLPPSHRIGIPQPWYKYLNAEQVVQQSQEKMAERRARRASRKRAKKDAAKARARANLVVDQQSQETMAERRSGRASRRRAKRDAAKTRAGANMVDQRWPSVSSLMSGEASGSAGTDLRFLVSRRKMRADRLAEESAQITEESELNEQMDRLRLTSLIALTENSYGATETPPVEGCAQAPANLVDQRLESSEGM